MARIVARKKYYRVIVRLSFDGRYASQAMNAVTAELKNAGLFKTGTGTWESEAAFLQDATKCLSDAFATLSTTGRFQLDHIWIYMDKAQP